MPTTIENVKGTIPHLSFNLGTYKKRNSQTLFKIKIDLSELIINKPG
jgi:hypothetical protein